MSFSDSEKTDIRRYCGYGVFGMGQPLPQNGYRFSTRYGVLEYKMITMGTAEEAVVRTTYLANLATLETAVVGASSNLDTDKAAVWTHNKNEVQDRLDLFDTWRLRLCNFLGLPPGPELSGPGQIRIVV